MKNVYHILPLFLTIFFISAADNVTETVNFTSAGLNLSNVVAVKGEDGREVFQLKDTSFANKSDDLINDLILSFNKEASELHRDDSNIYYIDYASYDLTKNGAIGNGAARFYKNDQKVLVRLAENLWLSETRDLGSFTIELRFKADSIRVPARLFKRVGFTGGIKNGIEIDLKDGRIESNLFNLFVDEYNYRHDQQLLTSTHIKEGVWYHYSLSYTRTTGKLVHYLNGHEESVRYVTKTGEPLMNILAPSFLKGDMPPVIIGENFYGSIDELRIAQHPFRDYTPADKNAGKPYDQIKPAREPLNPEGIITSPIYSFGSDGFGTMVTLFSWEEGKRPQSFIWFEFRISDNVFDRYSNDIPWQRIENNQRNIFLKKVNNEFLRGRYYQWRAHLIPSPEGDISPQLSNVMLKFQIDTQPRAPMLPEIVEIGDEYVKLRWRKNVEHDLGGYRIYYGLRSGKYDGVINVVNGSDMTNKLNDSKNYIEITVNNDVIKENLTSKSGEILNYPYIRNNVLYYFAVTAYDDYKVGTPYNHESPYSKEINARPFAGSEIN